MCILAILINDKLKGIPLIICNNRDEFFSRATKGAHIHLDSTIFSPIDEESKGSWLAIEGNYGRFAVVLNFHLWRYSITDCDAPNYISRGLLTIDFMNADCNVSAENYAAKVSAESQKYHGFNLIIGDNKGCFYLNNFNQKTPLKLNSGELYTVSNGILDDWEKSTRLKVKISEFFNNCHFFSLNNTSNKCCYEDFQSLAKALLELMTDNTPLSDATHGDSFEIYKRLSAIFVEPTTIPNHSLFGTRTTTIIISGLQLNMNKMISLSVLDKQQYVAYVLERNLNIVNNDWNIVEHIVPFPLL